MSLDAIDPYPWFLHKEIPLVVNHLPGTMHISSKEWTDSWRPFLGRLVDLHKILEQRIIVGIVGPPGAGKSFLAEQIAWLASRGCIPGVMATALPMDGFHHNREYLEHHHQRLSSGESISLLESKGSPFTYDAESLRQHLQQLREVLPMMTWPGYDRQTHEVVPEEHRIPAAVNMVLVEGNYLFLDRPPFKGIGDFFDLKIYVEAPAPSIMGNLMERHILGGRSMEAAKDWVKRVDLPNARLVESTRSVVDVVVQRDQQDRMSAVIWKNQAVRA
jgi:pantothenate kinase